jgi:hypothetical protein
MQRHFKSAHEGGGFICGDCQNEGLEPPLKRKDHFREHLQRSHGCETTARGSYEECPWPECAPENTEQFLRFSTAESLRSHIRQKHNGNAPGKSLIQCSIHLLEGMSAYYDLLVPDMDRSLQDRSLDEDEDSYTPVASRRATEGERNGLKRLRSDDTCSTLHRDVRHRHSSKSTSNPRFDRDNLLALEDTVSNGLSLNTIGTPNEGFVLEIATGQREGYVVNVSPSDFVYASACKFSNYLLLPRLGHLTAYRLELYFL